jgi:hypothetical protein
MNFILWLENRQRRAVEAAVLGSIVDYSEEDKDVWMGRKIKAEFHAPHEITSMLLKNGEIKDMIGDRDAMKFINTQDPNFGQFIDWLMQTPDSGISTKQKTFVPQFEGAYQDFMSAGQAML